MFIRLLLLLVCVISNTFLFGQYVVIQDEARLKIKTPDLAERKTLKIKLDNGLEAVLISDPSADQSAAVLTVKAGYWQDPPGYPGLAHFLEHMLFLGTKQYPVEDEYSRFISEHGGKNNAYTNADYTAYMFSIENRAFPEALDRFSSFFKDPLFNPSGVQREMNAVNQEYVISQENEDSRSGYVLKEIANPDHPYSNFNIGSLETLAPVTQEVLKNWYENHYSANLMRLQVISPTPLDQLLPKVEEDFGGIANRNLPEYENNDSIFPSEEMGKLVIFHPKKNINTLSIMWELPENFARMTDSKPDELLSHVLGHEGKESLLHELQKEHLAETLGCGCFRLSGSKLMMEITIGLTPEGVDKRNTVVERVFQTLAFLKEKGFPEHVFTEIQKMDQLGYEYQTRSDPFSTVMGAASNLVYENLRTYPEYSHIIQRFDPEAVQDMLKQMTAERAVYVLRTPAEIPGIKLDKEDEWLKIPHAVVLVPQETLTAWNQVQPNPEIGLPTPNPFIPSIAETNPPSMKESESQITPPTSLIDDPLGKVYFAPNTPYGTPEVYWSIEVRTSQIQPGNTAGTVLGDIYAKALNENLKDISYNAALAGLGVTLDRTSFGLNFTIHGYSDKAVLLWKEVVKGLADFKITQEQFNTYKESLTRDYQNFTHEKPYYQATELMYKVVYKDFTTTGQKGEMIPKITFERFEDFASKLWQKTFIQGTLYGQMQESQAKEVWNTWTSTIQTNPYPSAKLAHLKVLELNGENGPYYLEKRVQAQGNGIALGIENSTFSMKDFAAEQILAQALHQAFFNELRTKQQTGYAVFAYADELEGHLWTFFLEQSGSHENRDLLARFELFNEGFLQTLTTQQIPKERFETIKEALLTQLKRMPRSTSEMGALLNKLAFKYDGDFNRIDKRIQGFNDLTYEEFTQYVQQHLGKSNKRRVAVFVNGKIPKENLFQYQRLSDIEPLHKLNNYSSGKRL